MRVKRTRWYCVVVTVGALTTFTIACGRRQADPEPTGLPAELATVPSAEVVIDNGEHKRYFLIGPTSGAVPPIDGYKLAVVMPGGDGGPDFNPFVRRILKNALGPDWIIAEPIAFKWTPEQQIVWPTELSRVDEQQFSTESFVESVIADVRTRQMIDPRCIVTMSWSSSGPAAYAIALQSQTAVTGSYIAMSVFRPAQLPALDIAKGRRFYIEHSPDDAICPYADAEAARAALHKAGATVQTCNYEGGHGWRGNVYGRIRDAMTWLARSGSTSIERQR